MYVVLLTVRISGLGLGGHLEEEATWGLEKHVALYSGDAFVLRTEKKGE